MLISENYNEMHQKGVKVAPFFGTAISCTNKGYIIPDICCCLEMMIRLQTSNVVCLETAITLG